MGKLKLATVWLSGCSGCHMSFLDIDERLFELANMTELVYSPIADIKEFPEYVDITLVEGAVSNEEQLELLRKVRSRSKLLVALGDCAVTGNVTALRNTLGSNANEAVLRRAYVENATDMARIPSEVIPKLLEHAHPLQDVVKVDYYVPGCPPGADLIYYVLTEILAGRPLDLTNRFKYG